MSAPNAYREDTKKDEYPDEVVLAVPEDTSIDDASDLVTEDPRKYMRIYRSAFFQVCVVGALAFVGPAMAVSRLYYTLSNDCLTESHVLIFQDAISGLGGVSQSKGVSSSTYLADATFGPIGWRSIALDVSTHHSHHRHSLAQVF